MCFPTTTTSNAAQASAPYMAKANQDVQQQTFRNAVNWAPFYYQPNARDIENTLRTQTEYSDLMNREYERLKNPERASLRESYDARAADVFNPNQALLDEMLRRSVIATNQSLGPAARYGGGAANETLMRVYGPAYQRELERSFGNLTNYLEQNPRDQVTLDPSSYLNLTEGAKASATDFANQRRQELMSLGSGSASNVVDYNTGLMGGVIKEAGESAKAKTAGSKAQFDAMMGMAKMLLVEAPGAAAKAMKPM